MHRSMMQTYVKGSDKAVEFYQKAFDAELVASYPHSDGTFMHGYLIVYRGLEGLKADGTFSYSNGAADNGFGKMKFEPDAFKTDMFGYSKSSQGDANIIISYFINNKPVTKESYDTLMNEQIGKKDVEWYEFSQKNIETKLETVWKL